MVHREAVVQKAQDRLLLVGNREREYNREGHKIRFFTRLSLLRQSKLE